MIIESLKLCHQRTEKKIWYKTLLKKGTTGAKARQPQKRKLTLHVLVTDNCSLLILPDGFFSSVLLVYLSYW